MANERLFSVTRKKGNIKDKKIQFYQEERMVDDYGTPMGNELVLVADSVWAYVRQTSAAEYIEYKTLTAEGYTVDMLFRVNYRPDINHKMMIRYKDDLYRITRIDTFEGYKEDILISGTILPDDEKEEIWANIHPL